MPDLFITALMVTHMSAAAAWAGGSTMLELVYDPKIKAISKVQGALVSTRIERVVTIVAWSSLLTVSATGLLIAGKFGMLNVKFLLGSSGLPLTAIMMLTSIAIVDGLLITLYLTPKLRSVKFAESRLRTVLRSLIRANNAISVSVIILMVFFAEGYLI